MNRKPTTLLIATERLTMNELCMAPELPTLVTLDASLLAAISHLELQNPGLCDLGMNNRPMVEGVEEQIAVSIIILGNALRANLSAYYAAIKQNCDEDEQQEIEF